MTAKMKKVESEKLKAQIVASAQIKPLMIATKERTIVGRTFIANRDCGNP